MRALHAAAFCLVYVRELVFSTARLAWLVVQPKVDLKPTFVELPIDLKGEFPTLLFVCLVSMTPGSLSVALDRDRRVLLVHLLDTRAPEAEVALMKKKFEMPLLKIFGQLPYPQS